MLRVFCGGKLAVEVLRMADGGRENGRARVRDGNTMVMSLGRRCHSKPGTRMRGRGMGEGGGDGMEGFRAGGKEGRGEGGQRTAEGTVSRCERS